MCVLRVGVAVKPVVGADKIQTGLQVMILSSSTLMTLKFVFFKARIARFQVKRVFLYLFPSFLVYPFHPPPTLPPSLLPSFPWDASGLEACERRRSCYERQC